MDVYASYVIQQNGIKQQQQNGSGSSSEEQQQPQKQSYATAPPPPPPPVAATNSPSLIQASLPRLVAMPLLQQTGKVRPLLKA